VTAPIVIVEGNWLLRDDERWRALAAFCDYSLFIRAPANALRTRLVGRKLAGGLSQLMLRHFMSVPTDRMFVGSWK
jgi:pantothenate kinase